MVFYLVAFLYAWISYRRESKALKSLKGDFAEEAELPTMTASVEILPQGSALKKELKTALIASSRGVELQTHDVAGRVAEGLSWPDGTIRYCINGFVVVGLMGTLYAFYGMWQSAGSAQTTPTSDAYLANMARALSVSFVGLTLGLAASLFFSLLTASRKRLISDLSEHLRRFDNLIPLDSKTNLLLTRLLEPLNNLVTQLTIQNNTVLKKLIDTVDRRTEQLNKLIEDTTTQWRTTMQEFKEETLTAVGSLQYSSATLADSSTGVADTMREVTAAMKDVSLGLERTKDIALLVDRMEATSTSMIKRISERLEKASQASTKKLSAAAQQQKQLLEDQPKIIEKVVKGLSARAVGDFKSVAEKVTNSLAHMNADFAAKTDAVGSKWMSSMAEGNNENRKAMTAIANEWHDLIISTATTMNTALGSSDRLTSAIVIKMESLNNHIVQMGNMIENLKNKDEAPLLLSEISTTLTKLAGDFSSINQTFKSQADVSVQARALYEPQFPGYDSRRTNELEAELKGATPEVSVNEEVIRAIGEINATLYVALARLEIHLDNVALASEGNQ